MPTVFVTGLCVGWMFKGSESFRTLLGLSIWLQHVPTLQGRHAGLWWKEPDQALLKCQGGLDTSDNSIHGRERAGGPLWRRWAHIPLKVLLQAGKTHCKGQRLQRSCISHTQCEDCPWLTCAFRLHPYHTQSSWLVQGATLAGGQKQRTFSLGWR